LIEIPSDLSIELSGSQLRVENAVSKLLTLVRGNPTESQLDSDGYKAWLAEGRRLIADLPTESWDDNWINDDYYYKPKTSVCIFFNVNYTLFLSMKLQR
jgi:hypothetical protein